MRILALVLVFVTGCSSATSSEGVSVEDVTGADAGDAGPDVAKTIDAAPADPCRCDFLWSVGPEVISCFTRGACADDAVCVPTLPLTEQPSCHLQ